MLIKIGDGWFDEAVIAAIAPKSAGGDTYAVWLTTGQVVYTQAVREEVEAAAASLGVFSVYPGALPECEPDKDEFSQINRPEAWELEDLVGEGFLWIAKDKDGHVHAFDKRPELHGAYWYPAVDGNASKRLTNEFAFLTWESREALLISDLLY